jgi:uncharacterized protein
MFGKLFVNLTVSDLEKSKQFYETIGATINPQFTDENAACVVFNDQFYAMLLTRDFMTRFTTKEIIDAHSSVQALFAVSLESKEAVDSLLDKVVAAGGKETRSEDLGFMYSRDFEDLDGHIWEAFWMNPSHLQ